MTRYENPRHRAALETLIYVVGILITMLILSIVFDKPNSDRAPALTGPERVTEEAEAETAAAGVDSP